MAKEKRYVVTVDAYIYAENDYMARKRVHQEVEKLHLDSDSLLYEPKVNGIGEQPFASFSYRALEEISKPRNKKEKLPF
tara:strand:+ start:367 stop:603 length:237 start_codon:yes stop_codon:yes gene_type:complete